MSKGPAADACLQHLRQMSCELHELTGDSIDVINAPVDPCTFLRQYVGSNTPVLIKGAINHWPACHLWNRQYLEDKAGVTEISVDLTPNGYGDAVTAYQTADGQQGECFCIPFSSRMQFQEFSELFFQGSRHCNSSSMLDGSVSSQRHIPYLQQQNSNLTEELPQLLEDVDPQLDFAAAAFGQPPEAVNLWIGDERASTTFHKDHCSLVFVMSDPPLHQYENLYAVVRGQKIFHLLPPTEVYRMGLQLYPAARFEPSEQSELVPVLQQPPSKVLWCPIHPEPADLDTASQNYPLFFDHNLPKPLRVEVNAGDVLYLPAIWWHFVEQRACTEDHWCVAVNYWYDMRFDARYAAYKLVESLAQQAGLVPQLDQLDQQADPASPEKADEDDSADA